jgi:S-adenosyl-L-methionine hydrolase (adenosine-forming)
VTGGPASPSARRSPPPAVYFASDYGTTDEFVGVVHAVLHRFGPGVPVIDLSHDVPPFDVAAGADLLVRCAPVLGPGVVLAVVDPGVGSERRGVAIGLADAPSSTGWPEWLVGPDNGLLLPLAAALGIREARVIDAVAATSRGWPSVSGARTFDGRDLFAPAAAHLVTGLPPEVLGPVVDPGTLVPPPSRRPRTPVRDGQGRPPDDRGRVAVISWIDRFGNVQLDLTPGEVHDITGDDDQVEVEMEAPGTRHRARRVAAFADLEPDEIGLLADASGRSSLVRRRASATEVLGRPAVGDRVRIRRAGPPGASASSSASS